MHRLIYVALIGYLASHAPICRAQTVPTNNVDSAFNASQKWLLQTNNKVISIENALTVKTNRYLSRQAKQERLLSSKLAVIDSPGAKGLFAGSDSAYATASKRMAQVASLDKAKGISYFPYLDSLKASLIFFKSKSQNLSPGQMELLRKQITQLDGMEGKLQQAADIKAFMKERQQLIAAYISTHANLPPSITKALTDYKKETYYYSQQLAEYKAAWKDPDKATKKVVSAISKTQLFKDFMKRNSELAGLFNLPADYGTAAGLADLQTQQAVQDQLQRFVTNGGTSAQQLMQQNLQDARGQLDQLKERVQQSGSGGDDPEMPDFKPNGQRTKTFFKRLEYGSNIQTQRASSFFPTTSDVAVSIGYRLNDHNGIGIGASYKFGWGKDIRHIAVSSQGMGIRSYLDIRIKGSIYASGGFEYNYQQPFSDLSITHHLQDWQRSGLIGVSKIVPLKLNSPKKASIQLFWDFLSYSQLPKTAPLKFRVGYKF